MIDISTCDDKLLFNKRKRLHWGYFFIILLFEFCVLCTASLLKKQNNENATLTLKIIPHFF